MFARARAILALSLPLIAAQCAQSLMLITDTILFGLIGVDALAGAGLGASIFQFFFIVVGGLLMTVSFETAVHVGRSDTQPVAGLLKAGVVVASGVSLLVVIGLWLAPLILHRLYPGLEAMEYAQSYLKAVAFSMLPACLFMIARGLASGFGYTAPVMPVSLLMALLNIPVSYALMVGVLGLPALGVVGVALGTFICFSVGTALLLWRLWERAAIRECLKASWGLRLSSADFQPFWRLGLPIAGAHAMEAGVFLTAALMAGSLGTAALASHTIALEAATVAFNAYIGLAQGHAILVGQAKGAGRIREARSYAITGSALGLVTSILPIAVFLLWPESIIRLFTLAEGGQTDPEVLSLGISVLAVAAAFQAVDGAQVIAMASLRAIQLGIEPTVITVIGYWMVAFPLAWWLKSLYGLAGIWTGLGLGLTVTAVALLSLFHHKIRQLEKA